ncbi:MAG: peptidase domain-containing ABC transporter [Gammaproteobacteria bacterium]|nr:peptidase domain-containing ABC transporter [Gammaproteobacteria bacterium]
MSTAAPITSEIFAQALRHNDLESARNVSPYAACLLRLLPALGWRSFTRDILESLPHFSQTLDLADVRNMLVTLGYDSDPQQTNLSSLSSDMFPCLFVGASGDPYAVLRKSGKEFVYYDPKTDQEHTARLRLRGTAYLFTDTRATHAVAEAPTRDWFSALLQRFRKLVKHLLAMTLLLNIIAVMVPLFIMVVYDKVIGTGTIDSLPYLAIGMVIALGVELGLRLLRARTLGMVAGRLDYVVGVETFRQILYLPPLLTERSSVVAQLAKLKQFDSVREFFTGPTAALAIEAPFVLLFTVVIWLLAGPLAILPLSMLVLYAVFGALWLPGMNRKVMHAGTARAARQQMLMETFSGIKDLKALGAEDIWCERFREVSADATATNYRTAASQAVLESVTHTLMTLCGVGVLGFGTMAVMDGELSVGALIAVMALMWRVLGPIQGLFLSYVKFDQVVQGVRTINQLMKLNVEDVHGQSSLLYPVIDGAVALDRASFRYGPKDDPALLGASFSIAPNEFVAIVGPSGSGKSTVLKLIAGLYTAQSGAVLLDDTDARQFNPLDLRRLISYVPQNVGLFHGTIAQNLRLNNLAATDGELEDAAREAGVLDDINALSDGFNTRVGDNTTQQLPSGLLHGLCLARAYVHRAPVLLMDEPGASLDQESDSALIAQFARMRGTRTIVMVSHRPSHVRLADKVVVMHQGTVRFVGPPDDAFAVLTGKGM